MLPLGLRVEPGSDGNEGVVCIPQASVLLEPYHQIV